MNSSIDQNKKSGSRPVAAARLAVVGAVVLALLIALNVIVSVLPASYTLLDTSEQKMYTLNESTKSYLRGIGEDVDVYYVCQSDSEVPSLRIFLERFAAGNSHIHLRTLDSTRDGEIIARYTSETLGDNSIIVASARRSQVIEYINLYYVSNEAVGQMSLAEYESMASNLYYVQILSQYPTTLYFNGESSLTGAIDYVLAPRIPTVYVLGGHGETALAGNFLTPLGWFESKDLTLSGAVPDDACCIFLNAPTTDLSEAEAQALGEYLEDGGNLFLTTDASHLALPRLMSLLGRYGLGAEEGILYEKESGCYVNYPYLISAKSVDTDHPITKDVVANGYKCILPLAHGITVAQTQNVIATPLFTTSESAYTPDDAGEPTNVGAHVMGVAAERVTGSGKGSRVVWVASPNVFTDAALSYSNGNYYYFAYAMNWTGEHFTSAAPVVEGADMTASVLNISSASRIVLSTVLIVLIPAAFLFGGLGYWLKRRKR